MWAYVARAASSGPVPFYVATLTVASGEVSTDLTDFPIRVSLADLPAGFWAAVASDGSDIKMYDSLGAQLPRDLVAFDSGADTGDLFFKGSLLTASDNVFYVGAGSADAGPSNADTYGRNAVWTSYHRAIVFTGNSGDDRTGSGNSVSLLGNALIDTARLNTRDGAGAGEYATIPASYAENWTMGAIAGQSSISDKNCVYLTYGDGGSAVEQVGYRDQPPSATVPGYFMNNPTDGLHTAAGPDNFPNAQHFVAESRTGATNRKYYYDGANVTTDTSTTQYPPSGGTTTLAIGDPSGDGLKGFWTVVYLRHSASTDAWMAAEYGSWFVPSNFYTITE